MVLTLKPVCSSTDGFAWMKGQEGIANRNNKVNGKTMAVCQPREPLGNFRKCGLTVEIFVYQFTRFVCRSYYTEINICFPS